MIFRKSLGFTLLLCGSLASARAAQADTPFKFLSGATSQSGTALISTNGGTSYEDVYVGQYQIQLGSGANAKSLNTYCVDVQNDIFVGDTTTSKLINFTDPTNGFVTAAYNNGVGTTGKQNNANAVAYLISTYLNSSTSQAKAIDVGLSIWDIVNDNGNGISAGNFQVQANNGTSVTSQNIGDVSTDVSKLISAAYAADPTKTGAVTWIDNPKFTNGNTRYQDFAIHGADYPVPEASTLLGMGSLLALGGLTLLRRPRRLPE